MNTLIKLRYEMRAQYRELLVLLVLCPLISLLLVKGMDSFRGWLRDSESYGQLAESRIERIIEAMERWE